MSFLPAFLQESGAKNSIEQGTVRRPCLVIVMERRKRDVGRGFFPAAGCGRYRQMLRRGQDPALQSNRSFVFYIKNARSMTVHFWLKVSLLTFFPKKVRRRTATDPVWRGRPHCCIPGSGTRAPTDPAGYRCRRWRCVRRGSCNRWRRSPPG